MCSLLWMEKEDELQKLLHLDFKFACDGLSGIGVSEMLWRFCTSVESTFSALTSSQEPYRVQ
jgi:hypothetical protein